MLPAPQYVVSVSAHAGQFTIVVLALHYKSGGQTENIDWKPAAIVGSFYN